MSDFIMNFNFEEVHLFIQTFRTNILSMAIKRSPLKRLQNGFLSTFSYSEANPMRLRMYTGWVGMVGKRDIGI